MYVYSNTEALSVIKRTITYSVYSVCVLVALFIQHAQRMRLIILSFVACPLYPILPHYLINGVIFGNKSLF